MARYGLFVFKAGGGNTLYRLGDKAITPRKVGLSMLRLRMREDGDKTIIAYLKGWAEVLTETSEEEQEYEAGNIADHVADNLVYCNAPHIIDLDTNIEVGSKFKEEVCKELVDIFETAVIKSREKKV